MPVYAPLKNTNLPDFILESEMRSTILIYDNEYFQCIEVLHGFVYEFMHKQFKSLYCLTSNDVMRPSRKVFN